MPSINEQILGIVVAIAGILLPVLRSYVQSHFTAVKLQHVGDLAHTAVLAAEQLGNDTSASSAAKLNFASELLVSTAKRLGLKLTTDEVLGFVHAALRDMKVADYAIQKVTAPAAA